jgi:hypothetical protein
MSLGLTPDPNAFRRAAKTPTKKATSSDFSSMNSTDKQRVIDQILDKISKSGYDSLSAREKEILFKASNEK